jgi:predicted acyltransferase
MVTIIQRTNDTQASNLSIAPYSGTTCTCTTHPCFLIHSATSLVTFSKAQASTHSITTSSLKTMGKKLWHTHDEFAPIAKSRFNPLKKQPGVLLGCT